MINKTSFKLRVGRKRRQRRNCRHAEVDDVDVDADADDAKRRPPAIGPRQPQVVLSDDSQSASRKQNQLRSLLAKLKSHVSKSIKYHFTHESKFHFGWVPTCQIPSVLNFDF